MTTPIWAVTAIRCLGVAPGERFTALVDEPFADVGLALASHATACGAQGIAIVVPDSARPLGPTHGQLLASLAETDAVCFWFQEIHDGEFEPFRHPLYARAQETGTRIAFGGRLDRSMLEHEMAADYAGVQARCAALVAAIGDATTIRVTTPGGTDCTFDISGRAWSSDDGDLSAPAAFGNLPAGEIFIAPLRNGAEGRCVIDRSIAFGEIGLVEQPFTLVFEAGKVIRVEGGREAEIVWREIKAAGEGADIVAELGIGTNDSARITGSVITDEKVLGTAHVAFGDNSLSYGGDNHASIHVDGVMADATIEADGRVVLERGVPSA